MSNDFLSLFANISLEQAKKTAQSNIQYGTAGFRTIADDLDYVLYRMGLLATLRSMTLGGKIIGLMVTASHNPEHDNGVKLVDPKGEMLESSWETLATSVANAPDNQLSSVLINIVSQFNIPFDSSGNVYLGRDTRSSSERLSNAAKSAAEAIRGIVVDHGVVTTPMLHYFVAEANLNKLASPPSPCDYYSKLASAFLRLNSNPAAGNYSNTINFDGANGVGALAIRELLKLLNNSIDVNIYNGGTGRLNYMCGADFVKVNQKAPDGLPVDVDAKSVAVDGDADRLIYFYLSKNRSFHLLDGDRIATLLAAYLMDLLQASGLQLNIGLVHTAYANNAAINYISNVLKVPLACTETGVKYLHHKALEFDIGVYFEANGHGTVVYSEKTLTQVKELASNSSASAGVQEAAQRLSYFIDLTNQAVGDALSDMLLVETVLRARGWSLADWERCYTDLPNRLLKVTIKDRNVVKTTDSARRCVSPNGLQEEIERLVAKYSSGRSFVRASGTEDVVRVYSEAATQREADKLGAEACLAVYNLAGGVGEPPTVVS